MLLCAFFNFRILAMISLFVCLFFPYVAKVQYIKFNQPYIGRRALKQAEYLVRAKWQFILIKRLLLILNSFLEKQVM